MAESYVPEPRPAETRYLVGAHYFPGWKQGEHFGWELIEPYPERRPLLGLYDEGNPEVADWEIKWALEHGIGFFVYCWYRDKGNTGYTVTDDSVYLAHALHDGFMQARYADRFKFAIMWENENAGGADSESDLLDNLFPYWLERYFSHPSYLTIDGKPVLYVYHIDKLIDQLGGTGKVREALCILEAKCREAGFQGLTAQCEYRGTDPEMLARIAACGFTHSFAYCWHTAQTRPEPEQAAGSQLDAMKLRAEFDTRGFVPTVSVGWDPLPWHYGRGGRTPDEVTRWTLGPDEYRQVLSETKSLMDSLPEDSLGSRMLLLDNWNEWGEGHYIAPHEQGGFRYLQAVRDVFAADSGNVPDYRTPDQLGFGPYDSLYRKAREQGLLATDDVRVLQARDYGAVPDSSSDAGPGIRAAIEAARVQGGPAIIRLERGRYLVNGEEGERAAIMIQAARNLTLRGEGSDTVIVVTNPRIGGVEVQDSENVLLAHFAVDYDPLPYTQGTVTAVDEEKGMYEVAIDPEYRLPSESYFYISEGLWGLLVNNEDPLTARYGPHPLFTTSWEHVRDRVWRFHSADHAMMRSAEMKVGDRYAHMARRHSESAINFWRTRKAAVDGVTIYAGPSLASIWGQNEDVSIRALRVEVLPGSGRLLSANGDGIHNLGTRGGLLIEQCSFEGMGDDAINIHARAGAIVEASEGTDLVIRGGLFQADAGDMLQIYDPGSGCIRAEVQVKNAEPDGPGKYLVKLQRSVEGIAAGAGFHDADHVYNLSACGQGAIIRGNYFGRHRGRGVLLKTVNATVENNIFENVEGWGVAVQHEPDWEEGPVSHDITIRGNTFRGVGYGGWVPAVYIAAMALTGAPANIKRGRATRGITIAGNQFLNPRNVIVDAQSAESIVLCDNRISFTDGESAAGQPAILLDNVHGIRIERLAIDLPGSEAYTALHIKPDVDSGVDGVRITDIRREPAGSGPLEIKDGRS
ncbi:glycoside hydrolase family 99-like domain-containing protein [Paenibacillus nasutitermitis]|uniref:Right handed beta helix domain-containing protein n=1 Tax=Paenibacillus nasutitermitis TaxID=1652958 RepID=A0A917DQJ8_9BACL|nr:glycoside hydrolase family 99-like domain-containing protein [Paenibacillus nasutitermitis]GGD57310.1 hypothetical protein GCM10010911_13870 [Paenibacillus nasutitermitis]